MSTASTPILWGILWRVQENHGLVGRRELSCSDAQTPVSESMCLLLGAVWVTAGYITACEARGLC